MIMMENHLLIKIEDKLKGSGIAIPEDTKERMMEEAALSNQGEVAFIGDECKYVKIGDYVHYKNFIGNRVDDESLSKDGTYVVVAENDILAIRDRKKK